MANDFAICSARMVCGQSTITNDNRCDPFSGVGATGIAEVRLGTRRRREGDRNGVWQARGAHRNATPRPAGTCRREAAPATCRAAAALALRPSRHVLEGIGQPRCRIGLGFGGRKRGQLTAGRIQARAIGRVADIRNPDGRRAQALCPLPVAKLRGAASCRPGVGHNVTDNASPAGVKHLGRTRAPPPGRPFNGLTEVELTL